MTIRHKIKVELNILNSLIGSKNIEVDFDNIIEKYPETLKCIPILLAVRSNEIYAIDGEGEFIYQFKKLNYSVEQYKTFMRKTGLFDLIKNHLVNNLVDYVTGVETGLDSNGRKNRGGHLMEDLVRAILKSLEILSIIRKYIFMRYRISGVLTFLLFQIRAKLKNVLILWLKQII